MAIWDYYDNRQLGIVDFEPLGGKSLSGVGGCQEAEQLALNEFEVNIPSPIGQKGRIRILCHLPKEVRVVAEIYNVNGQRLERLSTRARKGNSVIAFKGKYASGVYFIRFKTDK